MIDIVNMAKDESGKRCLKVIRTEFCENSFVPTRNFVDYSIGAYRMIISNGSLAHDLFIENAWAYSIDVDYWKHIFNLKLDFIMKQFASGVKEDNAEVPR